MPIYSGELNDENLSRIFCGAADFMRRKLLCGSHCVYAYAIDGLIASAYASDYIYKPIANNLRGETMKDIYMQAFHGGIYNNVAVQCDNLDAAAKLLVNGFCVILFPGVGAIGFEVKTPDKRGTSAPEVESTVKGAKDAFVETIRSNTSYVRRHLRSPDLRLYETTVGKRTLTNVTVVYLEGITNSTLVSRMKQRLDEIDIDGLLYPTAVEEYVTGSRPTAFPLLQYTERTDRFCQGILEGRVGLLVDGLPLGYLAPVDVGYFMESPEDHSIDYVSASCIRVLRYIALFLSLLLPGVYVAMAIHHQEMIPLPLLRSIIESKLFVPFSTAVEVLGLLVAFELLQESGIHLPRAIGQSVSIIGGIVIGTAAVEAKLISPAALIAVSVAGICGFVQPNRDFAEAVRIWRFILAILGALAGLFGVTVGLVALVAHLSGLTSLGVSYLAPYSKWRDMSLLRPRHYKRKNRNPALRPEDGRNQQ
ncbi:MAG: spore germination protein [Ruminococcaceae bacterium]|nr:spore germination protein [Oscillospiraceae bacterium]